MEGTLERKKTLISERTPDFIELEKQYETKTADYERVKKEVVSKLKDILLNYCFKCTEQYIECTRATHRLNCSMLNVHYTLNVNNFSVFSSQEQKAWSRGRCSKSEKRHRENGETPSELMMIIDIITL